MPARNCLLFFFLAFFLWMTETAGAANVTVVSLRTRRDLDPVVAGEVVSIVAEQFDAASDWRTLLLDAYPFSSSAVTRAILIGHVGAQLGMDAPGTSACTSYARAGRRALVMLRTYRVAPFDLDTDRAPPNIDVQAAAFELRCRQLRADAGPSKKERATLRLARTVGVLTRSSDTLRSLGQQP